MIKDLPLETEPLITKNYREQKKKQNLISKKIMCLYGYNKHASNFIRSWIRTGYIPLIFDGEYVILLTVLTLESYYILLPKKHIQTNSYKWTKPEFLGFGKQDLYWFI